MRPGQAAPVFSGVDRLNPVESGASMRPGQAAPVFGGHGADGGGRGGMLQ